ncbi:MAG TPA: DUF2510 domain-containing protein [Acidimicrobiales bacterium]|nr:DUF2510 domain-containing protein [Acidimicrobiales bacterium]
MANTSSGGWHPDPTGRHQHRWWDGTQWTDQVSDGGSTSTDPMTAAPATPSWDAGGGPPSTRKGVNWKIIGIVGAVLVAAIVLVTVLAIRENDTSRDEQVDACVARGESRSQCECIIDEFVDGGGDVNDLNMDVEDPEDLPDGLLEAALGCIDG